MVIHHFCLCGRARGVENDSTSSFLIKGRPAPRRESILQFPLDDPDWLGSHARSLFDVSFAHERLRCDFAKSKMEKLFIFQPDTWVGHYRAYQSTGSQNKLSRKRNKFVKRATRDVRTHCNILGDWTHELTMLGVGLKHLRRIAML